MGGIRRKGHSSIVTSWGQLDRGERICSGTITNAGAGCTFVKDDSSLTLTTAAGKLRRFGVWGLGCLSGCVQALWRPGGWRSDWRCTGRAEGDGRGEYSPPSLASSRNLQNLLLLVPYSGVSTHCIECTGILLPSQVFSGLPCLPYSLLVHSCHPTPVSCSCCS